MWQIIPPGWTLVLLCLRLGNTQETLLWWLVVHNWIVLGAFLDIQYSSKYSQKQEKKRPTEGGPILY